MFDKKRGEVPLSNGICAPMNRCARGIEPDLGDVNALNEEMEQSVS